RWNLPARSSVSSGFTSTWNSKVTGVPASHLRLWMWGSAIGFSASCASAAFQLSRINSASVCCRMSSANCRFTSAAGAFPFAEPGKPGPPLVDGRGARLRLLDLLYRYGNGERSGAGLFAGLLDLDGGHATVNLITGGSRERGAGSGRCPEVLLPAPGSPLPFRGCVARS